ncbi:hypothetical protein Sjap_015799 [Stephania japonica]|uniref:Uncharacterized protein n=1 Tax=Stephania japonica TaxID=461633 RepID=A0AAP0ILT6_9MAGN
MVFQNSGASRCLLLDKDDIFLASGSMIVKFNCLSDGSHPMVYMRDHNAKITCMRLFPASKTSLFRNEAGHEDNFLVTSSCDHSIRLWWKGLCYRNFKGHNVPVTALSDKLLGEASSSSGNLIASGGEDSTVRLWSLRSNSKRGQHALRATLKGHGRAIKSLSVSGYKTSLLVSISSDAKIKVWDTAASSSACSSRCVGNSSVNGPPLGIKCFESLCYVAAGTSITAIDLRTMEKVFSAAACQPLIYSFEVLPSKSLVCTGGRDNLFKSLIGRPNKLRLRRNSNGESTVPSSTLSLVEIELGVLNRHTAMLWDVRSGVNPEPVIEMESHSGPVTSLHMDSYKIVTGSVEDSYCNVWDTSSGTPLNSLPVGMPHEPELSVGCSAMAVSGSRIVTTTCDEETRLVYLRDFINATCPKLSNEDSHCTSKFWEPQGIFDGFDD